MRHWPAVAVARGSLHSLVDIWQITDPPSSEDRAQKIVDLQLLETTVSALPASVLH
jgi:hypothetical protein